MFHFPIWSFSSNYYSKEGSLEWSQYPINSFSLQNSTTCIKFPKNYYLNRNKYQYQYIEYPEGKYSLEGSIEYSNYPFDDNCVKCPPGTYSLEKSEQCISCDAGTHSLEGSTSYLQCKDGFYSSKGSTSCKKWAIFQVSQF